METGQGLYLVFSRKRKKAKVCSTDQHVFSLSAQAPGFSIGRVHDKMGERLANNAELIFEDCFVPDENVVGEVGRGFQVLVDFFPQSNAYAAATVLGVSVAAYERSRRMGQDPEPGW